MILHRKALTYELSDKYFKFAHYLLMILLFTLTHYITAGDAVPLACGVDCRAWTPGAPTTVTTQGHHTAPPATVSAPNHWEE